MKVACIGTHNTGKTTFIREAIAAKPQYVTPVRTYRDVIKERKLPINETTTLRTQMAIFRSLEYMFYTNTQPNILFDRSPLDAFVYTMALADATQDPETRRGAQLMALEVVDLMSKVDHIFYFRIDPSIPLVADGTRSTDPEYQRTVQAKFDATLNQFEDRLPPVTRVSAPFQPFIDTFL